MSEKIIIKRATTNTNTTPVGVTVFVARGFNPGDSNAITYGGEPGTKKGPRKKLQGLTI